MLKLDRQVAIFLLCVNNSYNSDICCVNMKQDACHIPLRLLKCNVHDFYVSIL